MLRLYHAEPGIDVYCGDARELLPTVPADRVGLVLTDPPYGIQEKTNRRERKRGLRLTEAPSSFGAGPVTGAGNRGDITGGLALCNDFPPIYGDDEPFDPRPLLKYPRLILFGANWYCDRLPTNGSWLVWDKTDGLTSDRSLGFNDGADAELCWTSLGGPVRILRHRWAGLMKASERQDRRVHPTQKPVALLRAMILEWTQPGDLILDPYMGAGSTLRAAKDTGRHAIGCEMVEAYCAVAVERLRQASLPWQEDPGTVPPLIAQASFMEQA